MKRASILLLAVFAVGCGRKVVVHPDKLVTKGDAAWRITGEPGAPPPAATAPLPPTSPQGTPTAPPGVGTPSAPPASPYAPLPPSTPPPHR